MECFAGVWEHPGPGSSGRERGEAARRLYAVLPRSCLHQKDWSGEGGESERHSPDVKIRNSCGYKLMKGFKRTIDNDAYIHLERLDFWGQLLHK